MRTFDLAPLYRSTVGFDRLFSMLDQAVDGARPATRPTTSSGPARTSTASRVAVAGFAETELSIEAKENTLTIRGEKQAKTNETHGEVLYQGIAARAFERVFQLADFVQVKGATLENGLLHVDLVREIPEAKKPRQIRDRQRQRQGQGGRARKPLPKRTTSSIRSKGAPRFSGALSFCADDLCLLLTRGFPDALCIARRSACSRCSSKYIRNPSNAKPI